MVKKKILFLCMANTNRSPTFERYFKKNYSDRFEVKSSGVYYGFPETLTEDILIWADKVYVMDLSQEVFIKKMFPEYIKKIEVIGISDQYNPDEEDLIELIEYWIKKKKIIE